MTANITPIRPVSLKKAQAWIDKKRGDVHGNAAQSASMQQAMLSSIGNMLGGFGVTSLQIGDETFDFSPEEAQAKSPKVEQYWTEKLAAGQFVAMIQCDTLYTSYYNCEKVRFNKRSLEELIDADLVRELAPNAVIYGANDTTPWPDVIHKGGFQVWVEDQDEFNRLWSRAREWIKTEWHDSTLKGGRHLTPAEHVFSLNFYSSISPDLSWRQAQYQRAEAQAEQAGDLAQWDALAQQELKKAIGNLISLEGHPVVGALVPAWIEQMTPVLAESMEGKERGKKLDAAKWKAREHLYAGFKNGTRDWRDWTPKPPAL